VGGVALVLQDLIELINHYDSGVNVVGIVALFVLKDMGHHHWGGQEHICKLP
jgi:hypothetical protein